MDSVAGKARHSTASATTYSGVWPHPVRAFRETFRRLAEIWPTLPDVERHSPFVWGAVRLVLFLECVGAAAWCGPRILHQEHESDIIRRARRVEVFVLGWLLLCVALIVACMVVPKDHHGWLAKPTTFVAVYVAVNALVTGVAIHIVHPIVVRDPEKSRTVSSVPRLIILSFANYFHVLVAFVPFYWTHADGFLVGTGQEACQPSSGLDFLYISLASQLGLGFGELYPLSSMRWVTALQCLTGFLLAIVILSRVLGLLGNLRSRFEVVPPK